LTAHGRGMVVIKTKRTSAIFILDGVDNEGTIVGTVYTGIVDEATLP